MTAPELAGRLIEQVQRFGLASASAVIDRYTAVAEAALGTDPARPLSLESEQLSDAAAQAGAAYLALLAGAGALAERSEHRPERVDLPPVAAGATTEAVLYLHNQTEHPIDAATIRIGRFLGAGGPMTGGAAVVEPTSLALAAGASAQARLRVRVPDTAPPGSYFAVALATAAPGDPVVLRLEVLAGAAQP